MIRKIREKMTLPAKIEENVTDQLHSWGMSSGERLDAYDYLSRNGLMRYQDSETFFFTEKGIAHLNKKVIRRATDEEFAMLKMQKINKVKKVKKNKNLKKKVEK